MNLQEISGKTHYVGLEKQSWIGNLSVRVRRLKKVPSNWQSEVKVTPSKNIVKRARNAGT
jgi:hypothetical protein